ncbi:hypothetical protein Poli38472_007778 [Pythium oligandrum]|uniref:Uncharacterized protein n=1 Tax=Pythium oligandrum TaxID=41045 RepID=A0A8K1CQR9_PYTOL|nr:hypothetical protein Poli38472_007778 [Pythium oligandrum]|eukprot:TMW68106.1 hypothetical protein Poli38472_007778 [Pythium oligandrum]
MHQVRVGRLQHVAAPPAPPTPLELSAEEQEQLRIVRQQAFTRHQRNAVFTREILTRQSSVQPKASAGSTANESDAALKDNESEAQAAKGSSGESVTANGSSASPKNAKTEELQKKLDALKQENDRLRTQLQQQEETTAAEQARYVSCLSRAGFASPYHDFVLGFLTDFSRALGVSHSDAELLAMLHTFSTHEELATSRQRVLEEASRHAQTHAMPHQVLKL